MGIKEIAKEANVSISTVSRVLNGSALVNLETKQKVLSVVKKQQYEKNNLFELKNDFDEIAVIMPDITNSFFSRILQGIGLQADKQKFIINLQLSYDDTTKERRAIDFLTQKKIEGLILIRCRDNTNEALKNVEILEKFDIPFVLIDRDFHEKSYSGIFLSNANAVYDSIKMLLKMGNKKIAVLAGDINSLNSKQRIDGYKKALADFGELYEKKNIYNGDFSIQSGYKICNEIIAKKELPDVIFSLTNELTIGALIAIKEHGLILNKDIKLFSFNKIDSLHVNTLFDISYIEHQVELMGQRSVEILKSKLMGTDGSIREILPYTIYYKG